MIGSPSAVIGIGPLINCRMPISFSTGIRAAAASASGAKRSKSGCSSSGPKSGRMPVGAPRRRVRLPAADGERAGLGLHVEVVVGIAQRRQARRECGPVFSVTKYWCSTAHAATRVPTMRRDLAAPHAGRVDHVLGLDRAVVGDDARDAPAALFERGDATFWTMRHAAGARACRIRRREARRIDVAVAFDPGRADDARRLEQRKTARALRRAETSST